MQQMLGGERKGLELFPFFGFTIQILQDRTY